MNVPAHLVGREEVITQKPYPTLVCPVCGHWDFGFPKKVTSHQGDEIVTCAKCGTRTRIDSLREMPNVPAHLGGIND